VLDAVDVQLVPTTSRDCCLWKILLLIFVIDAPVFKTEIRQANDVANAAEWTAYSKTLKQKYGANPNGLAEPFANLAKEILVKLEGKP
jgi:hypothetical protein